MGFAWLAAGVVMLSVYTSVDRAPSPSSSFASSTSAAPSPSYSPGTRVISQGELGPVDWLNDSPLLDGVSVDSLTEADANLAFGAVLPSNALPPSTMSTTNTGGDASVEQRDFGATFDDPNLGIFWLVEWISTMSQADLERFATECAPQNGCESHDSLVPLAHGPPALLLEGRSISGLTWLRGNLYLDVFGPNQAFDQSAAVAIANAMTEQPH